MQTVNETHTPDMSELYKRFEIYLYDNISIAVLKKSPNIVMKKFIHTHEEYEFIIPITPIPGLVNEDAIYFGEPGFVYPVSTGRKHGLNYELTDVSHVNIAINKTFFEELIKKYTNGIIQEFNYEYHVSQKLYGYIEQFKRLSVSDYPGKDIELGSIVKLICFELIKYGINPEMEGRHDKISDEDILKNIADYLVANCFREISIDEICIKYNLSRTYFTKKFSKLFGLPPYKFVLRARIAKAKMLLEYENDTIAQIAEKCGILNVNQFSTLFKNKVGETPDEYRKNTRRRKSLL